MAHTAQRDATTGDDGPSTLTAFAAAYPDDAACADTLLAYKIGDSRACPRCARGLKPLAGRPHVFACPNGHQVSVTAGTVMHGTRTPLTTWFYAAYLASTLTPGISALQLQKQLGIGRYETAFQILHKIRSGMVAPDREPLHGVVEIDEAYVGGVEHGGKRGRGATASKVLVICAVEVVEVNGKPQAGRVRLAVIPDAKAATLTAWVKKNVAKGSTVYTDGLKSYSGLASRGYTHVPVLQQEHGERTGRFLPMVHLIISNLKRWLLGTYKGAVRRQHVQAYLNEFAFRFNRRFWRGPAFLRLLALDTAQRGPPYNTLYRKPGVKPWRHPNPKPKR